MNFHILTLFPEMVQNGLETSITGRAIKENIIRVNTVNIRDFSTNKHHKVDDYTYGGGAGMLMQPQPVFDAWKSVADGMLFSRKEEGKTAGEPGQMTKPRTIYVTPQGRTFTQSMAKDFAKEQDLVILCGHYEGIDERVLEEVVTDYVSIGDYVLTGGELAAMVMVDAVARLVPGVLNNEVSAETESFQGHLLEYPQYSRPEIWHDKKVPDVLLSGNRKQIEAWRLEQAELRTRQRRPDLYAKYRKLQQCKAFLMKNKLLHIDMIECINRGRAQLVYWDGRECVLLDEPSGFYYHTMPEASVGAESSWLPKGKKKIPFLVLHQRELLGQVENVFGMHCIIECSNMVYTRREKLSISGLYRMDRKATEHGVIIRNLTLEELPRVMEIYQGIDTEDYIRERIKAGLLFGVYVKEVLAGFAGIHEEGSIGLLSIDEAYRNRKLGTAMETYMVNFCIEQGWMPYAQVQTANEISRKLQEKLGFYASTTPVFWMTGISER